jgi:hypothetical protein
MGESGEFGESWFGSQGGYQPENWLQNKYSGVLL